MTEIAGDGDGMDTSPLPGPGVTDQTLAALEAALDALDAARAQLDADVAATDKAVDTLASWAEVVLKVTELVAPLIGQYLSVKGTALPQSSVKQTLFTGLADVWTTPKDGRSAALTTLLQGMLRGS